MDLAQKDMADQPLVIACYICGKQGERLLHPDELEIKRASARGCILCNYCHRPVCLDHLSPLKIHKLLRIRPQHFCIPCAESLAKEKGES